MVEKGYNVFEWQRRRRHFSSEKNDKMIEMHIAILGKEGSTNLSRARKPVNDPAESRLGGWEGTQP